MTKVSWLVLGTLLCTGAKGGEVLSGRVVSVTDGDTIKVLTKDLRQRRVRLAGIDAPEKAQPYGQRSKQHLSEAVFGKEVTLECGKVDRYGRDVCVISVDGRDANLHQIKEGMAWWYRKYASEQDIRRRRDYEAAETEARTNGRGLWTQPAPVPPWEWRRNRSSADGPEQGEALLNAN